MIAWYLLGGIGILLTYLLGGTKKRRTRTALWLKKGRGKIVGWLKTEHTKARTARELTPRAQKRAQRREQPFHAVLPIRKRTAEDPRTVTKIVNKVKLASANRKAVHAGTERALPVTHRVANRVHTAAQTIATRPAEIPGRRTDEQVRDTMTRCQAYAKETEDGTCHNPAVKGFSCWIPGHQQQFAGRNKKAV